MPFANHSDTFRSHDIFRFDLSDRYRRIIGAYRTPTVYGLRHTECAYYFSWGYGTRSVPTTIY